MLQHIVTVRLTKEVFSILIFTFFEIQCECYSSSTSQVMFQEVKCHGQLGAPLLESTGLDIKKKISQGTEEETADEEKNQERKGYNPGHRVFQKWGAWLSVGNMAEMFV